LPVKATEGRGDGRSTIDDSYDYYNGNSSKRSGSPDRGSAARKKSGDRLHVLEGRVKELEALLSQSGASPDDHLVNGHHSGNSSQAKTLSPSDTVPPPSYNPTPPSLPMNFADMVDEERFKSNTPIDLGFWNTALSTSPEDLYQIMLLGTDTDFPDPHVQDHLLDCYFTRIHRAVPILHPARFRTSLLKPMGSAGRPAPCLLGIVLALGATVSPLPEMRQLATSFYNNSKRKLNLAIEFMTNVLQITQTYILMSTYEVGKSIMGCSWMSAGGAIRSALAAALDHLDDDDEQMLAIQPMPAHLHPFTHRFVDSNSLLQRAKDWVEQEERRRAWWWAVAHDHGSSASSGWRYASDPRKCTTRLPMNRLVWERGTADQPEPEPCQRIWDPPDIKESDEASYARISILIAKSVDLVHSPSRDIQGCIDKAEEWKELETEMKTIIANAARGGEPFPRFATEIGVDWTQSTKHLLFQAAHVFLYGLRIKVDDEQISKEAATKCYGALDQTISLLRNMFKFSPEDWSGFHPFTAFHIKMLGVLAIERWHRVVQESSGSPIPQKSRDANASAAAAAEMMINPTMETIKAQSDFVLIRNALTRVAELWVLPSKSGSRVTSSQTDN